jgi:hypothetical protein
MTTTTATAIDRLLTALETGTRVPAGTYAADAVLDLTVPNWRFAVRGDDAIADLWQHFHGVPGHFEQTRRFPTETGEVVEYTLTWNGPGGTHAVHHCHLLDVDNGVITSDTLFCGGQWGPELLAEMGAELGSVG